MAQGSPLTVTVGAPSPSPSPLLLLAVRSSHSSWHSGASRMRNASSAPQNCKTRRPCRYWCHHAALAASRPAASIPTITSLPRCDIDQASAQRASVTRTGGSLALFSLIMSVGILGVLLAGTAARMTAPSSNSHESCQGAGSWSTTEMADKFDPYREALVMETKTIWPAEYEDLDEATKLQIAQSLHADPQQAAQLEYIRVHTGFCRQITVTADDVQRQRR
jgi:hypothetical protein